MSRRTCTQSMPLFSPFKPRSRAALPPAIAETPLGRRLLIGERGGSICPAAILLLALAALVLADSTNFLKKPLFFGFGAVSPPRAPSDSTVLPAQAPWTVESGLSSCTSPVVCDLMGRVLLRLVESSCRSPATLIGRLLLILPQPFLLAKLPALVALKPPAE